MALLETGGEANEFFGWDLEAACFGGNNRFGEINDYFGAWGSGVGGSGFGVG